MAPPLTLSRSGSIGSSCRHASTCAANASFSSIEIDLVERQAGLLQHLADRRHRADAEQLRRRRRRWRSRRSAPAASGRAPSRSSADVTITAAAPSLVCDELPAVTVPLTWNAGRSLASASSDVSRRGPSSVSNVDLAASAACRRSAGVDDAHRHRHDLVGEAARRRWRRSRAGGCAARTRPAPRARSPTRARGSRRPGRCSR